ncbi:MAG: phage portal protein [Candidatus Competibacteraceae bacterium]|nr:phage portal protein [Candidatus Competibacteraceae bacterium]
MISKACGGIKWVARSKRSGVELQNDADILKLLRRPNQMQGGSAFFEAAVAYLMITGNSFMEGVPVGSGPPVELWTLRPDKIRIIPGRFGTPAFYVFTGPNGQEKRFRSSPTADSLVMHMKTFHPTDNWYGMSPIEAAVYSIDQHNEAGQWNLSLLQNSARPSGAFVVKESATNPLGTLPDVQYQNLKHQIEQQISGSRNSGKPLLIEGGLDWKDMGMSPKDMDWLNGRNLSSRDIALAFGVPPIILNIPGDSTFANYREARASMYEDTILPLMDFVRDELNRWLAPSFGEDVELDYDRDTIEALADKRKQRTDAIAAATYLTTNEKREAMGYEPIEGGDVVLVNASQVPLELAADTSVPDDPPLADQNAVPAEQSEDDGESEEEPGEDDDELEADVEEDVPDSKQHQKTIARKVRQVNVLSAAGKTRTWVDINRMRKRYTTAMRMDVAEDLSEMVRMFHVQHRASKTPGPQSSPC